MSPKVLEAKLVQFHQVLSDLKPHVKASRKKQKASHYEIERLVQLCVDEALAMARRILVLKNYPVTSSGREIFEALHALGVIKADLCRKLQAAVGLRNLIVHEYGQLDHEIFLGGLKSGFGAFLDFAGAIEKFLG